MFSLPTDVHYLNCAYMSPLLKSVEEAGVRGIQRKRFPIDILPSDYFTEVQEVRELFGRLINVPAKNIALVSSSSYGLANAINNIPSNQGSHILMVGEEFPSDYFSARRWCDTHGKELVFVNAPDSFDRRGEQWNEAILDAINPDTAAIVMSPVHWIDGTKFRMKEISDKCKANDVFLILDGTQMIGATPFDASDIQPDAIICAGYKWLFGPYSSGIAYYSERYSNGLPIEESWMNRSNAQNFGGLTNYDHSYGEGAMRYNVGETSNFILMPMLKTALEQVLAWDPKNIEIHNSTLFNSIREVCNNGDFWIEEDAYRANHLFGIYTRKNQDITQIGNRLRENKIYVSLRSQAIRISPHVYNTSVDMEALLGSLVLR
jgi:selenocysteine lyase/cysteine desulfurase